MVEPPPAIPGAGAVRDVYAGDDDQARASVDGVPRTDVLFVVEADPDPDALARIAGVVGLANQAPAGGRIVTGPSGRLTVSLEIADVPEATRDLIRRKLLQLTCVTAADAHVVHRGSAATPAGAVRD
jgi:hypothetical protein